jgi:hypothetical protein
VVLDRPDERCRFIGMVQRVLGPDSPQVEYQSRPVVYQALLNPKK